MVQGTGLGGGPKSRVPKTIEHLSGPLGALFGGPPRIRELETSFGGRGLPLDQGFPQEFEPDLQVRSFRRTDRRRRTNQSLSFTRHKKRRTLKGPPFLF